MEKKGKEREGGEVKGEGEEYKEVVIEVEGYGGEKEGDVEKRKEKEKEFRLCRDVEKREIEKGGCVLKEEVVWLEDV
ncbi:hypothetical protein [Priestia megaterium]|uniref:hypothetical protein n=1 Tax=Priestia megaterium TaxID=1404 RepID=UPI0012B6F68F|nr:hypothetical protein [Priestia megaterium]